VNIPVTQIKWRKLTPKLRASLKHGGEYLWFRAGEVEYTTFWRFSGDRGYFSNGPAIIDPTHIARINKPRGVK
jgi:hypothetical protein